MAGYLWASPFVGRARLGALYNAVRWTRRVGLGAVLGNASALSITAVVTSALGFVFWSLAAREASPAAVGLAAAAVSTSSLLATVSMFGLGTLIIGEVAADRNRDTSLLSTALLVVATCGVGLGLIVAVLGPRLIPELRPLSGGAPFVVLFALAAGGTAVGLLIDQLMVGLLRSELQLARNTLYSLAKLGALVVATPLLTTDPGTIIFGVWPLGNLVSIAAVGGFLLWRPLPIPFGRPRFDTLRRLGSTAIGHHTLNLALQAPALVLPLLVTASLSTTANAYFYTSWMIASVAFIPQTALAVTLFALGARDPSALGNRTRLTLLLGFAEGLAAILVVQFAGTRLLAGFGAAYAAQASVTLRILIVAVLPMVIKTQFVALWRVRGRVRVGSIGVAAGACVELAGAAVGGHLAGLPGLSAGWVLGMCLEAACMLPTLWRTALPDVRAFSWLTSSRHSLPG